MRRLRLVAVQLQLQMVLDDGENILPGPGVQPISVTSADWPNVVDIVAKGMADLQAQVDPEPSNPIETT